MTIIFCCDPLEPAQPDRAYQAEVEAAREAGLPFEIINFERLTRDENAELAARRVRAREWPELAVYRGWMLNLSDYERLYQTLLERNLLLINTPTQYRHCHYLPESYEVIKAHTPQTIWLPLPDCLDKIKVASALEIFGDKPLILKDYVKSRKHEWHEACFTPSASDQAAVGRVVSRFLELQDDQLSGGLVFREWVKLRQIGAHAQSGMPLAREFRLFFWQGRVLHASNYWAQDETEGDTPPLAAFERIAARVGSAFFTMDVAQLESGAWIIIELGDGGVAGLPDETEAPQFYRALAARPRFVLYAGEQIVGWSALEIADAPMGCVAGVFFPNENYAAIEAIARANSSAQERERRAAKEELTALNLSVKAPDGDAFEPVGGVDLFDAAAELEDPTARQLSVIGLPTEVFQIHFREAFQSYYDDEL